MATSVQIQKQFDALHRDAEKVLSSINSLSQGLGSEGASRPALGINMEGLKADLAVMRKRLEETSTAVRERLEEAGAVVKLRAKELDSQVHAHPYPYIAGAIGLGAVAGWLLERRIMHSSAGH